MARIHRKVVYLAFIRLHVYYSLMEISRLKIIGGVVVIIALALGIFFWAKGSMSESKSQTVPAVQTTETKVEQNGAPSDISKVLILTYHSFGPIPAKKETAMQLHYRITADKFDAQMKYLSDHGYKTITFADLVENQLHGKPIPDKAIVLTFDDGWKSQYEYALPILEKYKFTGTFFIITNSTGMKSYMSVDELKDLHQKGFEIASHTKSHPKLPTLDDAKLSDELIGSKKFLEEKLGITVRTMAYPYYAHDDRVIKAVKAAGYQGARAGWGKFINDPTKIFELKSQEPVSNPDPFAEKRLAD